MVWGCITRSHRDSSPRLLPILKPRLWIAITESHGLTASSVQSIIDLESARDGIEDIHQEIKSTRLIGS
ncbi:hypothetical protein PGT21_031381 [Puccinia graminis f. sp. tritici]|uniref:Uncharacterized protein n=1 Tax=Puccinia graminis f. sp. tritici TaxID=56615 RepID=A0A5B0PVG2_PUCGR|nr:hypothetical protein PGT21_031381 [Puccinia graminis f. sp. tritici]